MGEISNGHKTLQVRTARNSNLQIPNYSSAVGEGLGERARWEECGEGGWEMED